MQTPTTEKASPAPMSQAPRALPWPAPSIYNTLAHSIVSIRYEDNNIIHRPMLLLLAGHRPRHPGPSLAARGPVDFRRRI